MKKILKFFSPVGAWWKEFWKEPIRLSKEEMQMTVIFIDETLKKKDKVRAALHGKEIILVEARTGVQLYSSWPQYKPDEKEEEEIRRRLKEKAQWLAQRYPIDLPVVRVSCREKEPSEKEPEILFV